MECSPHEMLRAPRHYEQIVPNILGDSRNVSLAVVAEAVQRLDAMEPADLP
jgi:hypothetical protein